jgi:hypothetical protein
MHLMLKIEYKPFWSQKFKFQMLGPPLIARPILTFGFTPEKLDGFLLC